MIVDEGVDLREGVTQVREGENNKWWKEITFELVGDDYPDTEEIEKYLNSNYEDDDNNFYWGSDTVLNVSPDVWHNAAFQDVLHKSELKHEVGDMKEDENDGQELERTAITLRGKTHRLTPFNLKYMHGQTAEHNVLSTEGHEWEVGESGQVRVCQRCFLVQCCPPEWVPVPNEVFSTEDIYELIRISGEEKVVKHPSFIQLYRAVNGWQTMLMVWDTEGFYDVFSTGLGPYGHEKEGYDRACHEGTQWAKDEEVEFKSIPFEPLKEGEPRDIVECMTQLCEKKEKQC